MFSSKLKFLIFLIILILIFIIVNRLIFNKSPEIFSFVTAIKTKSTNHKQINSTALIKASTETELITQSKIINQFLSEDESSSEESRLDEILNDCSKINLEEQYPIIEAQQEKIKKQFQASASIEKQVMAIMVSGRITDANRLALFKYVLEKPTDKIVYKLALAECIKNSHLPQCNDKLFALTHLADKNNAALLLDIASTLLKQGKKKEAQLVIEKASMSNYYNSYLNEYTPRFQNIFLSNSTLDYKQSFIASAGLTAALPFSFSSFIKFCEKHSHNNYVLSDACWKIGELMENHSYTAISQAFGLALQEIHFKQTNNQKSLDAIQKRRTAFNSRYTNAFDSKAHELILFDEELVRLWLEVGVTSGEKKAYKAVIKEVHLLLKNPDYNPCRNQTEKIIK